MVTIFKNIFSTATPFYRDVKTILERIKTGKSKELLESIRLEKDKNKRNELKKGLPSICFSGTFRQRGIEGLITHSGLICLDFDSFESKEKMEEYVGSFIKNEYTFASFISPSGNGIKLIVKIPGPGIIKTQVEHRGYFNALRDYYDNQYFDISCSDISRVCFESYDPQLYYNKDSLIWDITEDNEHLDLGKTVQALPIKSTNKIIENLQKWFDKKYSVNNGERNTNLFKLAISLNQFGISEMEADAYLSRYVSEGFNQTEINAIIKSAYKNKNIFNTKFFEDNQKKEWVERRLKSGGTKREIIKELEVDYKKDEIENVIKLINESVPVSEFWYFDDKGKCKLINYKFKEYLEQQGFFKLYPDGADKFIFVKRDNNMIENQDTTDIKDFVLNYLSGKETMRPFELMSANTKIFKEDYLNMIKRENVSFYDSTQDMGILYFNNGVIKVTKDGVELSDYFNLDGYVWKKHIINFDFEKVDFTECVFDRFIAYICSGDEKKILGFKTTIGYLLHSYKNTTNNRAIIFNDEVISENPNGGSGKGIVCTALGYLKRVAPIDGKMFSLAKSFPYQTVGIDTQILFFEDVKSDFKFENIFSLITEGITLEKKNKDAIKRNVKQSPKIVITTNYTIGGVGGSHVRRKWEIEFSSYFNDNHTPYQEFGHQLFDDWDKEEWQKFYNFMVDCLEKYLKYGLVEQKFHNLKTRKFIKETNYDFWEWSEDGAIGVNKRIYKTEYFNKFLATYPDNLKWLKRKRFSMWLEMWGEFKGYRIEQGRTGEDRYIIFYDETDQIGVVAGEEVNNSVPF